MLDYRPVGHLLGADGGRSLLLPEGRPLSYLRVNDGPRGRETLARVLLDQRATEFRRRIPLARPAGRDDGDLLTAFGSVGVSGVFPSLEGEDEDGSPLEVLWLDRVQLLAFMRSQGCTAARRDNPVAIGSLLLRPTCVAEPASEGTAAAPVDDTWQYWNSRWEFREAPTQSKQWYRVWPNKDRDLGGPLRLGRRTAARGTSVARFSPAGFERLGRPRYVVIEHPFRQGSIAALALPEKGLAGTVGRAKREGEREIVCLDRTARDALGISDGEFCLLHPWRYPRHTVWSRFLRDQLVGARVISANVRTSARADLEKPVCRLDEESLAAIGGRPGEFVALETLSCQDRAREGGRAERWQRRRLSQRVLAIEDGERSHRRGWEAAHSWDASSVSSGAWPAAKPGLEAEGFVDCAETLGVYPAYPTVYLSFYSRERLEAGLCQPVEIRVRVLSRIATELGNLAWLVLIGLIGTVAALLQLSIGAIAVLLATTLLALLILRAIRTIR